ncbi:DUF2231 domain-containing protein [Nocardioides bizhenqiangii]|uniref:DUF2231 domain-containing protein n=1 Tax=Nocardioides bizhenqiangii TaxID=3095076 RepID=A0ABZ0ZN86_9ACTN|nr:DUF2231 domain-containing protein [Nocardioides sp. HM61]WQQ25246.1 DUF2231 domain-containing protein [Nocardioides sp. HM61]
MHPLVMEINGLPLHALVVHGAVVLTPLAALAAIAYAVPGRWRDWLRWPVAVAALVAVGAVWTAYLTGEDLVEGNPYGGPLAELLETHESRANVFRWSTTGFAVVALLAAGMHRREGAVRVVVGIVLAGLAVLTLVYAVLTGDAGAQIAWYGVGD